MAAEVGGGDGGHKKGKKGRGKKGNPRIDMTPMVDLGFLLLTFFVLTTTMNTPVTMPIVVPEKPKENDPPPPKVAEGKVLILIVDEGDKIFWYQGVPSDGSQPISLNTTNFSKDGVRKVILETRKKINDQFSTASDPQPSIVLIKLTTKAKYKNAVDLLDEMAITEQKKYALVDPLPEELKLIDDYKAAVGGGTAATPSSIN